MDIDPGDGWDANGSPVKPAGLPVPPLTATCEWCQKLYYPRRVDQRFCCKHCNSQWYETCRPRQASAQAGAPRAGTIKALILGALQDGEWHSAHDLAVAVKADTHSVKARLSELQRAGHPIVTDLRNGNSQRPHRYRLV